MNIPFTKNTKSELELEKKNTLRGAIFTSRSLSEKELHKELK